MQNKTKKDTKRGLLYLYYLGEKAFLVISSIETNMRQLNGICENCDVLSPHFFFVIFPIFSFCMMDFFALTSSRNILYEIITSKLKYLRFYKAMLRKSSAV